MQLGANIHKLRPPPYGPLPGGCSDWETRAPGWPPGPGDSDRTRIPPAASTGTQPDVRVRVTVALAAAAPGLAPGFQVTEVAVRHCARKPRMLQV
jgi:hypothetical protein